MKRILSKPMTNAVGISLFSIFYAYAFFTLRLDTPANTGTGTGFWQWWTAFLTSGGQKYIAVALLSLTAVIALLLISRRRSYDEYHIDILVQCFTVALALTLLAIGIFYILITRNPAVAAEKFTLFASINWATVVIADLCYILLCGVKS